MAAKKEVIKSAWVCSKIDGLSSLLRERMPYLSFRDVHLRDLLRSESSNGEKGEASMSSATKNDGFPGRVLIADNDQIASFLYKDQVTSQFSFIQGTWAGVDPIINALDFSNLPPKSLRVVRFANESFSQLMAEYLIAQVINSERKFYPIKDLQNAKTFQKSEYQNYRCLNELVIGILGIGEMGKMAAKLFKSFGSKTIGLVRKLPDTANRCAFVDKYVTVDRISELLTECDYICNVLPSTPDTNDLLGKGILKHCDRQKPVFINIGRSNVLREADILEALDKEWLGGAVLDVFDEEPLPESSPLWNHPKVIITPHVAAISRPQDIAACVEKNIKSWNESGILSNLIDWNAKY